MPSDGKRYIFRGNDKLIKVEAVEQFGLSLSTSHYLDRIERHSFFSFLYWSNPVILGQLEMDYPVFQLNSKVIDTSALSYCDNLYLLNVTASYKETMHVDTRGAEGKLNNTHPAKRTK